MDAKSEELEIPKASIQRVVKAALPEGFSVATESKLALQKSARIFVHYLTACAQDISRSEDKSSITPEHVYNALEELEFNFAEDIKQFLPQYKIHKEQKQQQTKKAKSSSTSDAKQTDQPQEDEEEEQDDEEEMQIDEKDSKAKE